MNNETNTWIKALNFAAEKHHGQVRKNTGEPYVIHPIRVSALISLYTVKHSLTLRVGALLHDTYEDTDATYDEIHELFGQDVADLVLGVSSDKAKVKEIGKLPYLKVKLLNMTEDELTLKLCDRLDNVSGKPWDKYIAETDALMDLLMEERDLTLEQHSIVTDIMKACSEYRK